MNKQHKGHLYLLEKDCQVTIVTLIFADTGKMYNDVLDGYYQEFELIDVLEDLIAQGEDDRDREAEESRAFY